MVKSLVPKLYAMVHIKMIMSDIPIPISTFSISGKIVKKKMKIIFCILNDII